MFFDHFFAVFVPQDTLEGVALRIAGRIAAPNMCYMISEGYHYTLNEAAILLQRYCTDAGLTPLASEWWHFNDLDARFATEGNSSKGEYLLDATMSEAPEAAE